MALKCPSCGDSIKAPDIDTENLIAKCALCAYVFRFERPESGVVLEKIPAEAAAPTPDGIEILDRRWPAEQQGTYREAPGGEVLVIRRRWRSPFKLSLAGFILLWDVGVAHAFMATSRHDPGLAIKLVFLAGGILATYAAIANVVNSTLISIVEGSLTIKHGPLPWWNATVPARKLTRLWVHGPARPAREDNFQLRAEKAGGGEIVLLRMMSDRGQAEYLAHAIAHHLGIDDEPA